MIPVTTLITKLNDLITAGGLTDLELAQAFGAIDSLENRGVNSVATTSNLPPAANNKGRFFYITSENRYVLSNGSTWSVNNILRKADFNAYGWGSNVFGGLGDNTTTEKSSPVAVLGFTDWIQVSAGADHSLGVRSNGTAWAWGNNGFGRLGDYTTTSRNSPVSVVGNFTDWVQLSAGGSHSLGVRSNGTAWAWGNNNYGRLGDNTSSFRLFPVPVAGGFTDWVQVSAGSNHSLGVRANGTAWAWGLNLYGALGDNSVTSRISPVSVIGGFTDWVQVSANGDHSLGLRANGTAWAWGFNSNGRLGDNTTTSRRSPVSVVGGFTDWVQVSAGSNHSLGLRANGTAWAWGNNGNGRLGDNTITSRSSPVSVVGGFTDWVQVSAGSSHSLGLRANGIAWSWGYNGNGRLGDNTVTTRSSPVSVVGGFTDWVQVSAGGAHNMGIKA